MQTWPHQSMSGWRNGLQACCLHMDDTPSKAGLQWLYHLPLQGQRPSLWEQKHIFISRHGDWTVIPRTTNKPRQNQIRPELYPIILFIWVIVRWHVVTLWSILNDRLSDLLCSFELVYVQVLASFVWQCKDILVPAGLSDSRIFAIPDPLHRMQRIPRKWCFCRAAERTDLEQLYRKGGCLCPQAEAG